MIDIKAYRPGSYAQIKGIPGNAHELWYIVSVTVELVEKGLSWEMTQFLTILAVDENGDDIDQSPIRVLADLYDIKDYSN